MTPHTPSKPQPMNKRQIFDKICHTCGGLVARPNTAYGWGGNFCNCDEPDTKSLDPIVKIIECTDAITEKELGSPPHRSKPQPTEQPPTQSVFKEESPQPWEEVFEQNYYPGYFCDLNECDMTVISNPIWQDDTAGKRIIGEFLEKKECQCGGEQRRAKLKQFISSLLLTTKLELIKRFEEELIGTDIKEHCDCKSGCEENLWERGENFLRAEQRKKLTTMKEEGINK